MATERRASKRNRNSAKRAGAAFEISMTEYLREVLQNSSIDRQPKNGAKDLGDIARVGYLTPGVKDVPITWESKNTASINLTAATREARQEAVNYQEKHGGPLPIAVVNHKRHGVADPAKQWVTLEASEFVRLLMAAEGGLYGQG